MNKVYNVIRSMGMDGDVVMFSFSDKKVAEEVCGMYNTTSDAGDYDCFYCSPVEVDKLTLEDFKIKTDEDGDTELVWQ